MNKWSPALSTTFIMIELERVIVCMDFFLLLIMNCGAYHEKCCLLVYSVRTIDARSIVITRANEKVCLICMSRTQRDNMTHANPSLYVGHAFHIAGDTRRNSHGTHVVLSSMDMNDSLVHLDLKVAQSTVTLPRSILIRASYYIKFILRS